MAGEGGLLGSIGNVNTAIGIGNRLFGTNIPTLGSIAGNIFGGGGLFGGGKRRRPITGGPRFAEIGGKRLQSAFPNLGFEGFFADRNKPKSNSGVEGKLVTTTGEEFMRIFGRPVQSFDFNSIIEQAIIDADKFEQKFLSGETQPQGLIDTTRLTGKAGVLASRANSEIKRVAATSFEDRLKGLTGKGAFLVSKEFRERLRVEKREVVLNSILSGFDNLFAQELAKGKIGVTPPGDGFSTPIPGSGDPNSPDFTGPPEQPKKGIGRDTIAKAAQNIIRLRIPRLKGRSRSRGSFGSGIGGDIEALESEGTFIPKGFISKLSEAQVSGGSTIDPKILEGVR